jgi:hypothetical protein
MSPSEHQSGRADDYHSQVERHVNEWPTEWLVTIKPVTEARCREYIGELNQLEEPPTEVIRHFAERIDELQE